MAQCDVGDARKLGVKSFADVIFYFVHLAGGELFPYLNMEIDMDVILHAVGADGVGTADARDGFGDGAD